MPYINSIDPHDLATRFSTEDMLEPLQESFDQQKKDEYLRRIRDTMERLPPREADLVELYFFKNKKQTDIAEIFEITQAAVSYRLKRALERIAFLVDMPNVSRETLEEDLRHIMPTSTDAMIYVEMYETSCQSEVAERLEITQGRVRHRYLNNLVHLGRVVMDSIRGSVRRNPDLLAEVGALLEVADQALARRDRLQQERNLTKQDRQEAEESFEEALKSVVALLEKVHFEEGDESPLNEEVLRYAAYYRVFVFIRYNFNILREVQLPRWSGRSCRTLV